MKSCIITNEQLEINKKILLEAKNEFDREEFHDFYNNVMEFKHENHLETLLEAIIGYAEEHNLDMLDVADVIKKDNTMSDILTSDLIKNKQIKFFI